MKIVFDCGRGGPEQWGPESINEGIGGSEECIIYLSRELAALGHEVVVSNKCGYPRKVDGVQWVPPPDASGGFILQGDILVAWRDTGLNHPDYIFNDPRTSTSWVEVPFKKRYLYCHDVPVPPHYTPDALSLFDKIILLNQHHRARYGVPEDRAFVCQNGVDLKQFDQAVGRQIGKCVYLSHPSRGLDRLREYWPKIREAIPYAELHAFWWQPEEFRPANESIGIMPMRNLGHMELAREILSADLFTYCSTFEAEINPISCIKAQVGGAWPVVVIAGGMVDTIQFGYLTSHEQFADEVIKALQNPAEFEVHRKQMMVKSRERYDWKSIAKIWASEFESVLAE